MSFGINTWSKTGDIGFRGNANTLRVVYDDIASVGRLYILGVEMHNTVVYFPRVNQYEYPLEYRSALQARVGAGYVDIISTSNLNPVESGRVIVIRG